jgi:ribosome biogenesis GTPase
MTNTISLSQLGWKPFFQQQLYLDDLENKQIARVINVHRSNIELISEQGEFSLPVTSAMPTLTTGDWVLVDAEGHFDRELERQSLFSRKAPGSKVNRQLIAANIDTVFIVCSLNNDLNLNRIERYLALAKEAMVEPVIVLTKQDQCDDLYHFIDQVRALDTMLMVEAVNGLDAQSVQTLVPWCGIGKTVAFLGSSGVGKSTLVNTLLNQDTQATRGIREDDSKGRHTTTSRSLHLMPSGGLLLDTPGMRELQLADCAQGIEDTFAEISQLAMECRFSDCQHQEEPGCAVHSAIKEGELEERRLISYQKLMREQALNSATLAEKRAQSRSLSRTYRAIMTDAKQRKTGA